MASSPRTQTLAALWRDLTGQSVRWGRTLVLTVVIGRVSILLVGLPILLLAGEEAMQGFSGQAEALTGVWVFAALVFAPLSESLVVRLLVWLLGSRACLGWPVWATAIACGALSVPLHGLSLFSLAVAPFFALMAAIQHHWMNRGRGWAGFWLITVIHAVANGLALIVMALMGPGAG